MLIGLTNEFRALLDEQSLVGHYQLDCGQKLMDYGEEASYVYWVERGLLRAYYVTCEGKEVTKEFYWEGDVIYAMASFISGEPLPFSVIAIEDCQLLRLPKAQYRTLVQTHSLWQDYHQQQLQQHVVIKEHKEAFLLLNTPEQRVELFHRDFPALVTRINDYLIASYLAMTPISYSRIKKRLKLT